MELFLQNNWKKIGISLSGGADSALLAFLICKQTDADIHFLNQVRMWKTRPWQIHVADQVINWFGETFNNNFFVHRNFIPPELEEPNTTYITDEYGKLKPGNRIILRAHAEFISHREKLNALYAAVTRNPDLDFPGALPERDNGVLPLHFIHNDVNICHPFAYTRKDWVISQYYANKITDLLNITRSCEGEFENLDYTNYIPKQYVPTCGKCFWCKEREWAIEKNTLSLHAE